MNESLEAQDDVGLHGCYAAVVEVPGTALRTANNEVQEKQVLASIQASNRMPMLQG